MEQVKPRLLLVVPMLHQGGFERVCVRTARILRNDFEVTIAMFSDADIAYDISGLSVVNLDVPAQDGKLKKMVNVVKRTVKLRKLKKKLRPDLPPHRCQDVNQVRCRAKAVCKALRSGDLLFGGDCS